MHKDALGLEIKIGKRYMVDRAGLKCKSSACDVGDVFEVVSEETRHVLKVRPDGHYYFCYIFPPNYILIEVKNTSMQKEDAIKQLAKLQGEVDKLKAIIDKPSASQLDLLPSGWYMDGTGGISYEAGHTRGGHIGNAFATKQQAKHFAEYYKIWCLVNSRCAIAAEGFNCGVSRAGNASLKYSIIYSYTNGKFIINGSYYIDSFGVHLPKEKTAQEVADWLNNHVSLGQDGWYLDGTKL